MLIELSGMRCVMEKQIGQINYLPYMKSVEMLPVFLCSCECFCVAMVHSEL